MEKKMSKFAAYTEKIKASKEVYDAINGMEDDQTIYIQYGKDKTHKTIIMEDGSTQYKTIWQDKYYEIRCHTYGTTKSWAIYEKDAILGRGMNVDSMTKTTLTLYTFDLFNNKTTHRLPLSEATLIKA